MTDVKQLITEHLDIWLTAETEKKSGRGRSSGSNDTIYGVQKLRELILDLAIQGKLSEHRNTDTPAKIVLENIANAKSKLVENGEIKEAKKPQAIGAKEIPFKLPNGWEFCRLENLTSLITKGSSPKWQGVQYTENSDDVLFITSENVGNYQLITHNFKYVEAKFNEIEPRSILKKDDFLMNIVGGSIGRTAIYDLDRLANINQAVCLIRTFCEYLSKDYLLHFFNSNLCKSYMFDKQVDNARANLSMGNIAKFIIPIPPLEEQHRIVEKVDELMQLCDQLEQQQTLSSDAHATLVDTLLKALTESSDADEFQDNWKRIVANFDVLFTTEYSIEQLKQTVLRLAVMGKLVKQDPSDEPASELLKKIADEKAKLIKEGKIKKSKPLPEIAEDEKPFELPSGWEWEKLGNISLINSGNAFSSQDFTEEDGLHRVIKITNIGVGEFIESSDYLNIELNKKIEAFQVFQDDLLLALTRPYISTGLKICKCPQSYDKSLLNQRVSMIRPFEIDMNEYIYLFMRSDFVLNLYKKRFSDSGLQPNLKMEDVTNLVIPLPPLIEQKYIIEKVSQLFSIIEQLQVLQSKLQKTKLHLADALVANAVEGG